MENIENYELLAARVIDQAVSDYEYAKKILDKGNKATDAQINEAYWLIDDVKEFFYGEWYKMLATNTDGPTIFNKIKENYEKTGKCRITEVEE